jgi:hypothetical protein
VFQLQHKVYEIAMTLANFLDESSIGATNNSQLTPGNLHPSYVGP